MYTTANTDPKVALGDIEDDRKNRSLLDPNFQHVKRLLCLNRMLSSSICVGG